MCSPSKLSVAVVRASYNIVYAICLTHHRVLQGATLRERQLYFMLALLGRGENAPTPTLSGLLRKWPVLPRPDFNLTKDPKWPCEGQVCGKIDTEG